MSWYLSYCGSCDFDKATELQSHRNDSRLENTSAQINDIFTHWINTSLRFAFRPLINRCISLPRICHYTLICAPLMRLHGGNNSPDSKVHGDGENMGPIWDRQDPGWPHVGPMNFAIWEQHRLLLHDPYRIFLLTCFYCKLLDRCFYIKVVVFNELYNEINVSIWRIISGFVVTSMCLCATTLPVNRGRIDVRYHIPSVWVMSL